MAADCSAACWASPSLLFPFKKCSDSTLFDEFEILDHAHLEEGSVAIVDANQSITGKVLALITVRHFLAQKKVASLLEEGTLLVP